MVTSFCYIKTKSNIVEGTDKWGRIGGNIYITPFLRIFISERTEHVFRLKKAYLKEEAVELESGNGKSVRKKWVEKDTFD